MAMNSRRAQWVVWNDEQGLSDSEKAQGRNNIGAAALASLAASFESRAPSYNWSAGEVCTYGGKLWQFDANHSGAWTGADAHEVKTLNSSNVADEYDPTATYPIIGTPCIHAGAVYRSNTAINVAEAWNPSHWDRTNLIVDAQSDTFIYGRKDGGWARTVGGWIEIQIAKNFNGVDHYEWCKLYYNDAIKLYSLNFWCTITNITNLQLGWNNLFKVNIDFAPNILNFACRSKLNADNTNWVSENIIEQIGFVSSGTNVYLSLFNSGGSGHKLYYAPTIQFPATYFLP